MIKRNLVKKDIMYYLAFEQLILGFTEPFHMDLYFSDLLVAMNLFDSTVKYDL